MENFSFIKLSNKHSELFWMVKVLDTGSLVVVFHLLSCVPLFGTPWTAA